MDYERLSALIAERAHLRQELDTAKAELRAYRDDERRLSRGTRWFFDAIHGKPYEDEVRSLFVRLVSGAP